jgi:ribonuclease HI
MLGCYRTTATDALENETSLLPPRLRLREKVLKSVTRMLTAPPHHPQHHWIQRAREPRWQMLSFPTNLINITKHFPECIRNLETIVPYIRPPWWFLKASIHIDVDKESAEAHHIRTTSQPNDNSAHIYTDGSGINDGIAATMYCHTDQQIQQRYLGKSSESMVYAGELEAIHMAVGHAKDLTQKESTPIFSDNQPAMQSLAKPKRQSGQAIIERILNEIEELYLNIPSYSMQFEWVPGHVGIYGNEKADQTTKSAAIDKVNPTSPQTMLKSAWANEIQDQIWLSPWTLKNMANEFSIVGNGDCDPDVGEPRGYQQAHDMLTNFTSHRGLQCQSGIALMAALNIPTHNLWELPVHLSPPHSMDRHCRPSTEDKATFERLNELIPRLVTVALVGVENFLRSGFYEEKSVHSLSSGQWLQPAIVSWPDSSVFAAEVGCKRTPHSAKWWIGMAASGRLSRRSVQHLLGGGCGQQI